MEDLKEKARRLMKEFKGERYIFGIDCLERVGELVSSFGQMCLLITNLGKRSEKDLSRITESLDTECVEVHGPVPSAKLNAPREDVLRLAEEVRKAAPDSVLVVAGGSGIDAAKAAGVIAALDGDTEDYFGVGRVSERISTLGKDLLPLIAVQTASSSASHLTKYANITDMKKAQKKLIADEAIVPPRALFDYRLTHTMPPDLTLDGAFDGMAHCIEVFYGASPDVYDRIQEVASTGLRLIISSLEKVLVDGEDMKSREALGLGTDLGGYAIMLGGTNGPHLTSFSLVDILSHGRAAAIMIPYYTVFFAPAIQKQLQVMAGIFSENKIVASNVPRLKGKDLAEALAEGMVRWSQRLGFPSRLSDVPGFSEIHIRRALDAAKDPQLEMKLKNMPVPLTSEMVEDHMGPVLEAARNGDFSLIRKKF